jgi:hypothetical protein
MPRLNRQNIDRKTNKPDPIRTEGLTPDLLLQRSEQTRRDDDVIRTAKRTIYDIDYAMKWFIDNEIRPQIIDDEQLIPVPVIFANGEKWDNVRRLGYMRDEKGMLQSPAILLKRNSVAERDSLKTLDVNRPQSENVRIYKTKYTERNRYEDTLYTIPTNKPLEAEKIYIVDIPKYVTIEYELLLWCDFTEQINELIDQILPYGRFAWGNDENKFTTTIGSISFETVNTIGEDRLVRATIPLTVLGTLLSEQEARRSTIRKMYSVKKVSFDIIVTESIFETTVVPPDIIRAGSGVIQLGDGVFLQITPELMTYLTNTTDRQANYSNATTVTVSDFAAINPVTMISATKNEFDIFINGSYIDKQVYTWTPNAAAGQTIVFDTNILGFNIEAADIIIINGRWA